MGATLGGLPPRTTRVFVLREVIEMDASEVCRELDLSSAYCSLVYRARVRMSPLRQLREGRGDVV
jgi:RNA polymerase sigma-70 factor, ECF subfamily